MVVGGNRAPLKYAIVTNSFAPILLNINFIYILDQSLLHKNSDVKINFAIPHLADIIIKCLLYSLLFITRYCYLISIKASCSLNILIVSNWKMLKSCRRLNKSRWDLHKTMIYFMRLFLTFIMIERRIFIFHNQYI